MADSSSYDLKPIKAPQAAGTMLKLLTGLIENRVTGGMLAGTLLKEAGVLDLRKARSDCHHPLTPPVPGLREPEPAPAVQADELAGLPKVQAAEGFAFETIDDFTTAYREGKTTPAEVAERVLTATRESEATDPPMRVFISQDADDVRAMAEAATKRWASGKPLGPLDGVPVAVKDELDQVGYPTTVGTSFLGDRPADKDAWPVARMRQAGAVLSGKANMTEIGIHVTGINPHHGTPRNPYDPARMSSGSSSGPAVAVAAGLCPVSIGADGGGSIRNPAAFCGLVGLKASYGRVSETGAAPLCWSVAHVGPLGATARDVAIGYGLMAGTDPDDPNSLGQPAPHLTGFGETDLAGVKLGVFRPWFEDAEPAVVQACQKLLDGFVSAGAEVVEVEVPELALLRVVHMVTIVAEMRASHSHYLAENHKRYGHDTRINMKLASRITASDYVHAQRLRVHLCERLYGLMERVHAIVTPTAGCVAPVINPKALKTGESNLTVLEQIMRFAPAANLTGLPAISIPAGYSEDGLPVGFQAMGRMWDEHLLLKMAAIAETLVPRQAPKVHYRLLS